jgi:UDP-N-acetylglucosamine 2-epimerase
MKVVSVVGARPQFIKVTLVSRLLREVAEDVLVHTGQHYDRNMSTSFFEELDIPQPDIDLQVGSGTHGFQTARMLEGIEKVLQDHHPDWVVVYGDTNSTLAGALAAAKLGIPVAHVEAGLRSGNRAMPEEINRVLTDHLADLLLCPTQRAVDLLAREGIVAGVRLVGDVMVDMLQSAQANLGFERVAALGVTRPYFAATLHRAENVDEPHALERALSLFAAVPGTVVVAVHPRTRASMERFEFSWPDNTMPLDPLGYVPMLTLVKHAEAVLTDSGGLQKESVLLGTRCVTLREETEWPETLEGSWNSLVGLDRDKLRAALSVDVTSAGVTGFGDGQAAARIVAELVSGAP